MIRQARTYLVGATSAATLVAAAIALFVLLVSAQVFTEWPIAGHGGADEAAVSDSRPLEAGDGRATTTAAGTGGAADGGAHGPDTANGGGKGGEAQDGSGSAGVDPAPVGGATAPIAESPTAETAPGSGGNATAPTSGGGSTGSGGGSTGSGGGSTGSNSGSAGGGGSSEGDSSTASSTSAQITGGVSEAVNQVDETVLGGALGQTGVTEVTERVVESVAGPESTVGKAVDGAAGAVGGILGGGR
jgi:hypothetical protein